MIEEIVKGVGVHPPPSPGWAKFSIETNLRQKVAIATRCVLCGIKHFIYLYTVYMNSSSLSSVHDLIHACGSFAHYRTDFYQSPSFAVPRVGPERRPGSTTCPFQRPSWYRSCAPRPPPPTKLGRTPLGASLPALSFSLVRPIMIHSTKRYDMICYAIWYDILQLWYVIDMIFLNYDMMLIWYS
jgi:hypothetical protein